jgi:hypothetical protein
LLTLFAYESELTEYGENMCRQWYGDLHKLPTRCEQEADILHAKRELEQMGQAIRLHNEALRTFQSADSLLKRLRTNKDTAEVEDELSKTRQAMAAGHISLDKIKHIRKLCASVATILNRPESQELQSLPGVLAEIRDWGRVLGTSAEEERSLEQRRRQLSLEWRQLDPDTARDLLLEAETLRGRLAALGRTLREGKLTELEELLVDVVHALGPQPNIRQRLDALAQGDWDSVHRHKKWLENFKETDAFFKAISSDQEIALQKRLRERCAEILEQLRQLQDQPLLNTLRRQVEMLEQELEQLSLPQEEGQDLLRLLRLSNGLFRQVGALEAQAQQDRLDLHERQSELNKINTHLLEEAVRIGCTVKNLAPLIKALNATASDWVLDAAYALAQSIAGQLEANRQVLIQHCQTAKEALLADLAIYKDALLIAGFASPPNRPRPEPPESSLYAEYLASLAQERRMLEQQTLHALTKLHQHRERLEMELTILAPKCSRPDERQEAEALLIQVRSYAAVTDQSLAHLRALALTVEACADFLERLYADQQGWQVQLDAL